MLMLRVFYIEYKNKVYYADCRYPECYYAECRGARFEFNGCFLLARALIKAGNTKGGCITVPLTSCLTGLESAVWNLTIFVFQNISKINGSKYVPIFYLATIIISNIEIFQWKIAVKSIWEYMKTKSEFGYRYSLPSKHSLLSP